MRVIRLNPGFSYSPLRAVPRNAVCLCGSGKKWKRCHMLKLEVQHTSTQETHRKIFERWKAGEDTTIFFQKKPETVTA